MIKRINEDVSVNRDNNNLHINIPVDELDNFSGDVFVDIPGHDKKKFDVDDYNYEASFEDYDEQDSCCIRDCDSDCDNHRDKHQMQDIDTQMQESTSVDPYIKAYLTAMLAFNDFKHIYIHAVGANLNTCQSITMDYYYHALNDIDILMPLAVESKCSIPNGALALSIIKDYAVQSDNRYDLDKVNNCAQIIIKNYVEVLRNLYKALDTDDKRNTINNMIRDWSRELNYTITRRGITQ